MALLWGCFLARGAFYSAALPLWEGFDEYAHFAYVQRVATRPGWFVSQETRPSREVERSVELVPMPWVLRSEPPPHETYESYWRLPADERRRREGELAALPRSLSAEDATSSLPVEWPQPPLSYWLMAAVYHGLAGFGLPARVLALRLFNILLASAAVPAAWMAARRVFGPFAEGAAVACAAVAALMPGMMFDAARVANDPLGIALFSVLSVLCLEAVDGNRRAVWWLGAVLGLGLLTKAFFLSGALGVAAVLAWAVWKGRVRLPAAAAALGLASAIGGWWYVRNVRVTGSVSSVIQDAALRNMPLGERLRHVTEVSWLKGLDSTFFSHIWFGGWSFLQLRAWIYHVFAIAAALAVVGLVVAWVRQASARGRLFAMASLYVTFCAAIGYHVLITFLSNGISSSGGWYLYAVAVPEIVLAAAGLRALAPPRIRPHVVGTAAAAFAALDLYGMLFVALPYYSGLIGHRANGFLEAFHFGRLAEVGLAEVVRRIAMNKPGGIGPTAVAVLACAYLAATCAAAVAAIREGRGAGGP